jgi:uncharacterized repeat protein (TIGR01451 family)
MNKKWMRLLTLCVFFVLQTQVFAQGFALTALTTNQPTVSSCNDSTVSISVAALGNASTATSDFNLVLLGSNFTASQLTTTVDWGDGTTTSTVGSVSAASTLIQYNPALTHMYGGQPNQYTITITVTNPQNNTSANMTLSYSFTYCQMYLAPSVQVDCDANGTVDSTLTAGIPILLTNQSNSNIVLTGTYNNNVIAFYNYPSGVYTISVSPSWLAQHGYVIGSVSPSIVNASPATTTFTTLITLNCDTVSPPPATVCQSGMVFCDADANGLFSAGDSPIINAPVLINANGVNYLAYSNVNGYYTTNLPISVNTPLVISLNANWLAQNGYTAMGPQTALAMACPNGGTTNFAVNCTGGNTAAASCVAVRVFCDANGNGTMDSAELPIVGAPVQFINSNQSVAATVYSDSNGVAMTCGNFFSSQVVFAQINTLWMQQHGYSSSSSVITVYAVGTTAVTPTMYPINCGGTTQCADLYTSVSPWIGYYQGTTAYIKLHIGNYGPSNSGPFTVSMNFPAGVTVIPSSINLAGYTISGNTITWNISNVAAGYSYYDVINFTVPSALANGTAHYYTSTCTSTGSITDCNPSNNAGNLLQLVGSSYDPNDKTVDAPEVLSPVVQEALTYTIRFQNTGTAPAQNIYVMDTLSSQLDWSTFELIESSHPMQVIELGNGIKRFDFPQIWLPDSTANEAASHGHLIYRIKESPLNIAGSSIYNTAYIYFDWNDAVVTNTTYNINGALGIGNWDMANIKLYPNPAKDQLTISAGQAFEHIQIVDLTGKMVFDQQVNDQSITIATTSFENGTYIVQLVNGTDVIRMPFVKH